MNKPVKAFRQYLLIIPKWLRIVIPVIALIAIISFFAVGWYFSSKLLAVNLQKVEFDQTVTAVSNDQYTIEGSAYNVSGVMGYIKNDRTYAGLFNAPQSVDDLNKRSVRTLRDPLMGTPILGEKLSLQGNIWISNPKEALGIDYSVVTYDSPVGQMDAWKIPGNNPKKWTIAVHGIGADKNEILRFVRPIHEAGSTTLVINYRNDSNNPASPDGYTHLGDTEWQDLEAAVRYAKTEGATEIQLYGSSLGGSITQNYLRRSNDVASANITKVVLDSPALNWHDILDYRVSKMGYPSFISKPGKAVASMRSGIDFDRITTEPGSIRHQTLIIHNSDDESVPQAASKRVAEAQPNLVTLVDFGSGGHIRAWNHDQVRYEKLVSDFLR